MAWLAAIFAAVLSCVVVPRAMATATVSFGIDTGDKSGNAYTISPYLDADRIEISATLSNNPNYNPAGFFWAATNTQAVTLYTNAGIRLISVGGVTADGAGQPNTNEINHFFNFAQAANIQVNWLLGMSNADTAGTLSFTNFDQTNALYIVQNFSNNLLWLAIGNERDAKTTDGDVGFGSNYTDVTTGGDPGPGFQAFWPDWKTYYTDITNYLEANGAPLPPFGGDDAVIGHPWWTEWFAQTNVAALGNDIFDMNMHFEPLSHGNSDTMFDDALGMLSSNVDTMYFPQNDTLLSYTYKGVDFPVSFTEFNAYHGSGAAPTNTGNGYANTLYGLDAIHWWGQEGIFSLNWLAGATTFFFTNGSSGNANIEGGALAYACAAYNEGGGADVYNGFEQGNGDMGMGIGITNFQNPSGVNNATVYAVGDYNPATGHCTNLYVTIINTSMTSPPSGRWQTNILADFTVGMPEPGVTSIHRMVLQQANGFVTATNGITLGHADLNGGGAFQPQWENVGILNFPFYKPTVTNLTAQIFEFSCATN